jgi:quercetin dioxygenase-like cupin family protein
MPKLDIKCIVSAADTEGRIAVFEEIVEPGIGPPRHTHRNQLEIFHLLEGNLRFEIDGEIIELEAGAAAVVPVGAVHAFRNIGSKPARIHFELLPARESEEAFDQLVAAGDAIEDIASFFDRYGMDLIGPPLD